MPLFDVGCSPQPVIQPQDTRFGSSSKMTPSCKWRFGQYLTGRSPVTFVQETRNRTVMSTSMSKKRVEGEIKQSNFIFASASQFCCLSCQCMTTT